MILTVKSILKIKNYQIITIENIIFNTEILVIFDYIYFKKDPLY
jgi:hypothetical protein